VKISELSEIRVQHLVWRIDHKTPIGLLTAARIARGEFGDLEIREVFVRCGLSARSAAIHAGKVERFWWHAPNNGVEPTGAIGPAPKSE